ncbi:MAG: hypothetical protein HZA53_17845 [Planctomycetes bacterium]|nr:hypothetical protein [Planctomycetota bacterium]
MDIGLADELGFAVETSARTTDATGSTTWERVGPGKYRLAMKHPGYWPAESVVDHAATDSTQTLEVRRIGNLELVVKNTLGNPQEGALVELTSVEQSQDVSAWVERGLVTLSRSGWKTGPDGRLRMLGLPNGAYRWRVTPRNGEAREGESVAPPMSTGVVEVRVE